jgi:hypothetical protein
MHALGKRYGCAFTVRLPFFGPTVIVSDPALVTQFFQTRTDVVRNVEPNLDLVLGPGSTFGLQDEEHRRRGGGRAVVYRRIHTAGSDGRIGRQGTASGGHDGFSRVDSGDHARSCHHQAR